MEQLVDYCILAVRAAEQMFTPEQWMEKKEYVTAYITDIVNNKLKIGLDEQDINNIIEGVVNEVKKAGC